MGAAATRNQRASCNHWIGFSSCSIRWERREREKTREFAPLPRRAGAHYYVKLWARGGDCQFQFHMDGSHIYLLRREIEIGSSVGAIICSRTRVPNGRCRI
ncbi:uncharacterized protein BO95DRAFT_117451 [Aspergillus brunneoviolaceus CBS 621.78]|uniref:Uncharacterized protein n=1 Tax=Aspergillus brunneoviolaceus CBS 621.78 TaxID=1450534 RepID=A0ACD1GP98_9EURO|nr:hypothetical protein BO95DRAFT_117451 [Aspergillus brunneoviolaceus CBS 621.78]RAH50943.1 hypothetical protein BO95DRAFT_117451 [Aspergillus brunneoviolaceus CBS 621.78]